MKIVAIIQARMGSSRLPDKMALDICGFPLIDWVLRRTKESKSISKIVLATSVSLENFYLVEKAKMASVASFQGDEINVLGRFDRVVSNKNPDYIIRICGDNPLITATEIDRCVRFCIEGNFDYAFNHIPAMGSRYIDGVGAEVLTIKTFKRLVDQASTIDHFEHVTKQIFENWNTYNAAAVPAPKGLAHPNYALDVNTQEEYLRISDNLQSFSRVNFFNQPEDVDVFEFVSSLVNGKI